MAKLYQLQLDQSLVDCGMSYAIQLESGHFFLVDGGYFTPGEAERLYHFLCAHCEGKPVIVNWFFTHAHQDHIGVFMDMMESHAADLQIHKLSFNFQPLDLPATGEGWREKSNDLATVKRFYEVLDDRCANIPRQCLHTGDAWQEEELRLEVLYTWEELDRSSSFNDHSTVLKASCGKTDALFLGDIGTEASRVLLRDQREKLKSRMVQVAHHGLKGATIELYRAIDAEIALWSIADYKFDEVRSSDVDRYLLEQSMIRRHVFNFEGTACLPMEG